MFFAAFRDKLTAANEKEWMNHENYRIYQRSLSRHGGRRHGGPHASDRKARRAVSRTVERMGKAMDSAFEDVKSCLH